MAWLGSRAGRKRRRREGLARPAEVLEDRTMLAAAGVGVFSPDDATWSLRSTASAGAADAGEFQYGSRGLLPLAGDWDGDGTDEVGFYDRSTGTFRLRAGTSSGGEVTFKFGAAGLAPVVGDWDGDGDDEVGVYNRETGAWRLRDSAAAGRVGSTVVRFDGNGIAVAGDWDGDGTDGLGFFARNTGTWRLRETPTDGLPDRVFRFGGQGGTPVVGDWDGDGSDGVGVFRADTARWVLRNDASAGAADAGAFVFGGAGDRPVVGTFEPEAAPTGETLLTLRLKPIDLDLLGLRVTTDPIVVTVSAEPGDGSLLGNLLSNVSSLVNLDEINAALNAVLGTTVDLVNAVDLRVEGVGEGAFSTAEISTTDILSLYVAPVELDLLGANVTTSPIKLNVSANAGDGQVLGNVLTALTDLFNPPLPEELDLATIVASVDRLLADLNAQIPGIPAATTPTREFVQGDILSLTVPQIDLDLLGLVLQTTPITVDARATSGDGLLLGNILTSVLNTLEATPEELHQLSASLNDLLAKVVGVLNASTLVLPGSALDSLSDTLRTLALPDLITAEPGARTTVLDLVIASSDGTTPPVMVDLLGLEVTTSNIDAVLIAETGEGNVLGNLVYNVSNLLNPGGSAGLFTLITDLASGTSSGTPTGSTADTTPGSTGPVTQVLTLELPPIDLDLLGLQVRSSTITVTVSAQSGDGKLLGNALTGLSTLIDGEGVSAAVNEVLGTVVSLVNSTTLTLPEGTVVGSSTAPDGVTPILTLMVAPVRLDLLGVIVETSPIALSITAVSGDGLVLGNVLTSISDLFNPPLPEELDLEFINGRLDELLLELEQQVPGVPSAEVPPTVITGDRILSLTLPALDLDLLGLLLATEPITVNADATSGDGLLLGNVLTAVLNTLDATPEQLSELSGNLNELLAKVFGVLNASDLVLADGAIEGLTGPLQTLALPDLIASAPGATTTILDLSIASTDGTTPPVSLDLLGLEVTTSDIDAVLSAQTGDGQVLGNLLYNVANLLNRDSPASLLFLLSQLAAP